MTEGESAFVEEMGQTLAGYGMTPMAGRMWGWLLICEPPEQTAADIAEALQASRGAISGTARILTSAGRIYRQFREMAERGLTAMAGRPPESRARLQELRDVFAFVEQEVPAVVDRFLSERAGRAGRKD
jgi:hypothetical protein